MISSLIISLILTLIIELIVSIILGIRTKKDIIVVICANICTNPVVVYIANIIIYFCNLKIYYSVIIILEVLAVTIEALIYKKYLKFNKFKNRFCFSLINNVLSFFIRINTN